MYVIMELSSISDRYKIYQEKYAIIDIDKNYVLDRDEMIITADILCSSNSMEELTKTLVFINSQSKKGLLKG